ncbi:transposase, partial [Skermanella aerolata]
TNEDRCRAILEAMVWPSGPVCPDCGSLAFLHPGRPYDGQKGSIWLGLSAPNAAAASSSPRPPGHRSTRPNCQSESG